MTQTPPPAPEPQGSDSVAEARGAEEARGERRRALRRRLRWILGLGGLLVVLGVCEVAARLLLPLHPRGWFVAGPSEDRYFVPAPDLTYSWGSSTFTHGPEGTPQGSALRASAGRTRIAFVGDSVCYGFFASGEENLTRRVEQALGPQRFEVLNFGVPGYNAHMVSATLREQALEFGPRAVVYVFHQNDLTNASHADAFRARPSSFRERYDPPAPFLKRVLTRSRFLSFALDRLRASGSGAGSEEGSEGAPAEPGQATQPRGLSPWAATLRRLLLEEGPHRRYFREHLEAMRAACAARGVAFALLFVPREETLALDGAGLYRDALAQICRDTSVVFLDGQAALAGANGGQALYGDPSHPNARGHALLAEVATAWLRPQLERP